MKNIKNKKLSKIIYGLSFLIFMFISLWGIFFLDSGDEMGYVVLNFYIVMPLTSFIMAIILGLKDGYLKWGYPIVFGVLGIIIPALIFKASWDWISIFFSLIPGFIGLLLGLSIYKLTRRI